jgi:hypothetical protein
MDTQTSTYSPLDIIALGSGLSAALFVLFVICVALALVFPDWRASHGWIGLVLCRTMRQPGSGSMALPSASFFWLGHRSRPAWSTIVSIVGELRGDGPTDVVQVTVWVCRRRGDRMKGATAIVDLGS